MQQPSAIIVEDDAILGGIFAAVLEASGLTVELIGDGADAIERICARRPDLLILDLHLPHTSGLDILRCVRADADTARTRVVVVSADANMAHAAGAEADIVLLKPVTKQQILAVAKRLT